MDNTTPEDPALDPTQPVYKPGDVANGYFLTHDRGWTPFVPGLVVNGLVLTADRVWVPVGRDDRSRWVSAGLMAGSVLGLFMAFQSASLLTGTGSLWVGVGIAGAAAIAACILWRLLRIWVPIVALIAVGLALLNVVYVEVQMQEKRQEISEIFNG